jgi:thymidine phosphorylase
VALTVELGAEMLVIGQAARDLDEGRAKITRALQDGSAREKFGQIIAAQHGDRRVLDDRSRLPQAPHKTDYVAAARGRIVAIDSEAVGVASLVLGGGRLRAEDGVDPRVGLHIHARLGDVVEKGQPIATLHHADRGLADALARLQKAYVFADPSTAFNAPDLFVDRIAG